MRYYRQIALGDLKLTPEQFAEYPAGLFWDMLRGHYRAKRERQEFDYNLARLVTTSIVNAWIPEPAKRLKPGDLWPDFDEEIEDIEDIISDEDWKIAAQNAIAFLKHRGNEHKN